MGYPSQPQGPYGQQPYGYSHQPPTGPPPPRRNTGLIVLLTVGIPLLLLGSCAAVVLIVTDTRQKAVVTEADSPIVMPSRQPEATAPSAGDTERAVQDQPSPQDQPSTAAIGSALTLEGQNAGLKVTVTVAKVIDPATPESDFMKPKAGNRFVALEVTLTNVGQAVYSDAPTNGAMLIDGEGQQYRSTLYRVREGQSLNGSATINVGDTRKGVIAFEVPEGATLAKLQFALNSGFADQKGEWALS